MSYTKFSYSALSLKVHVNKEVSPGTTQPGGKTGLWTDALTATFTVKNVGHFDGNEVAQLYLVRPSLSSPYTAILKFSFRGSPNPLENLLVSYVGSNANSLKRARAPSSL